MVFFDRQCCNNLCYFFKLCTFVLGGSLEIYGAIPEPVLGRITVAVSYLFDYKHTFEQGRIDNNLGNFFCAKRYSILIFK